MKKKKPKKPKPYKITEVMCRCPECGGLFLNVLSGMHSCALRLKLV